MAEEAERFKEDNEEFSLVITIEDEAVPISENLDRTIAKSWRSSSRRPPHNYVEIIKDAVLPVQTSSLEKLCGQLYEGVVLHQGKRKYWVDRELNMNCFMLFARDLTITWSDNTKYWHWTTVKESGGVDVEVAELIAVCWLSIRGKFRTILLSPKTQYQVVLEAKMLDQGGGWAYGPVTFDITLPDKSKVERKVSLRDKPKNRWFKAVMGEFETTSNNIGEITFSIFECSGWWKRGLAVKGVAFEPKKN